MTRFAILFAVVLSLWPAGVGAEGQSDLDIATDMLPCIAPQAWLAYQPWAPYPITILENAGEYPNAVNLAFVPRAKIGSGEIPGNVMTLTSDTGAVAMILMFPNWRYPTTVSEDHAFENRAWDCYKQARHL